MSRSSYYYEPYRKAEEREVEVLQAIVAVLREKPFYGYRKVWREVRWLGVTEKQVRRIMHRAGLRAIYPRKRLSISSKEHRKYPYLLKDKEIWLPNQVWATDITYIRLSGGYVYLRGNLGPVFPQGIVLEGVQHDGGAVLCVGVGRGDSTLGNARYL